MMKILEWAVRSESLVVVASLGVLIAVTVILLFLLNIYLLLVGYWPAVVLLWIIGPITVIWWQYRKAGAGE